MIAQLKGDLLVFYDRFIELCKAKNVKPTPLVVGMGLSSSNVSQWKKGSTPRPEVLAKLADYFEVPVAYLMGYETEKKPAIPMDDELLIKLDERPKLKELVNLLVQMDDEQLSAFLKLFGRP